MSGFTKKLWSIEDIVALLDNRGSKVLHFKTRKFHGRFT